MPHRIVSNLCLSSVWYYRYFYWLILLLLSTGRFVGGAGFSSLWLLYSAIGDIWAVYYNRLFSVRLRHRWLKWMYILRECWRLLLTTSMPLTTSIPATHARRLLLTWEICKQIFSVFKNLALTMSLASIVYPQLFLIGRIIIFLLRPKGKICCNWLFSAVILSRRSILSSILIRKIAVLHVILKSMVAPSACSTIISKQRK